MSVRQYHITSDDLPYLPVWGVHEMMCVMEGSPQCPVSHYPQTFMRSCLSHAADTIETDSLCCTKRKTAFKIHASHSNYYSSIEASAQLRHSITLPLMEENLRVS